MSTTKTTTPSAAERDDNVASTASLVQPGQALESSRDSGFDLPAAVGEPTDNSIQAGASIIRIATKITDAATGETVEPTDLASHKGAKRIDQLAVADDGHGVPEGILANVLSLGYGTRMNDRAGLGRFGMGLKLAALSQARRLDVWTKAAASDQVFHAYLDLDDVIAGTQTAIEARPVDGFPAEHAHLMTNPKKQTAFTSGTLVVWSKIDRLEEGGRFGMAIRDRLQELTKYLARTYRVFLDRGLYLELNNHEITLHDPLFLLDNPRVVKQFGPVKAQAFADDEIEIDGHTVRVRVTLLPQELRPQEGEGGRTDRALQIPDNHHRVSILRQEREIFYDSLHHSFFPHDETSGGRAQLDRFIGVEISFPAALDEYFRVRNVKKGAEPDAKLREEIRQTITKPFRAARAEIRAHWEEVRRAERANEPQHQPAEEAVARAEEHTPPGQAGRDLPPARQQQIVDELVADLDLEEDGEDKKAKEQAVREAVETKPISVVDLDWPGKELVDITHLNGKAVVKINRRHPFIREIYTPLKELAGKDPSQVVATDVIEFLRKVEVAFDVLFMAYAKAENMDADADVKYADLRSYWGQFTAAYITEALRG